MTEIAAVWFDEAARVPLIDIDGEKFYLVWCHPSRGRELKDWVARQNWRDYWRALRILRGICQCNRRHYMKFTALQKPQYSFIRNRRKKPRLP